VTVFGRLVDHDERSRSFVAHTEPVKRSVLWAHRAPVLYQGDIGSCTGNAAAQLINTDYFESSRVGFGRYLDEADALHIYSMATQMDGIPDNDYPPTDGGSSGLGVAKAGKKLGFFSGYTHTFTFDQFTAALQVQPVLVGTDWHTGMMKTSKTGIVHPTGSTVGGHEYLAIGVDYAKKKLAFLNSWGPTWGVNGRFYMSFADFGKLLDSQGDVTVPLRAAV